MGLGLVNAKLTVNAGKTPPPVQKIKPARPSIAEDAIFIPKPHKRVDFVLEPAGGGASAPDGNLKLPGSSGTGKADGQLKGFGPSLLAGTPGNGSNIAQGQLGPHGVTAESPKIYSKDKAPQVVMVVDSTPAKDYSAIATQQEGRQINHDSTVYFTQQYDSYGRPRVGMSREPYDFAFTKFMVKTSQIHFQENVQQQNDQFKNFNSAQSGQTSATGAGAQAGTKTPGGASQPDGTTTPPVMDATSGGNGQPSPGMISSDPAGLVMGANNPAVGSGQGRQNGDQAQGMINPDPQSLVMGFGGISGEKSADAGGKTAEEVAAQMGINAQNIMVANAVKGGNASDGGLTSQGSDAQAGAVFGGGGTVQADGQKSASAAAGRAAEAYSTAPETPPSKVSVAA